MPYVLALASAVVWGSSDFLGGLSSRRAPTLAVFVATQSVGLAVAVGLAGALGGHPSAGDLAFGALGGLLGGVGLFTLYRGLATGPMSVVAPVSAAVAAAVPVAVGLALGERPGALALAGILVALPAIAMIGAGGESAHASAGARAGRAIALRRLPGVAHGLVSGLGFAAFFVFLARTSSGAGLWPLVAAKAASVAEFALLPAARRDLPAVRPVLVPALAAGTLDMAANALYVVAVRASLLSVVPVLASLYPGSTVLLSRAVLGERIRPVQAAGIVLALVAVAMISAR